MRRATKPSPKHRASHRAEKPRGARGPVAYSAIAAAATGAVVTGGVATATMSGATAAIGSAPTVLTAADLADRQESVSRSAGDRRTSVSAAKASTLSAKAGTAVSGREKISIDNADPRAIARALMPEYGLRVSEFGCLDRIWTQESNWNVHADNPHSSAYGIPQALPGSKMASVGPDWANNAETQIRWGLGYIRDRYGSACNAWGFKAGHGWY